MLHPPLLTPQRIRHLKVKCPVYPELHLPLCSRFYPSCHWSSIWWSPWQRSPRCQRNPLWKKQIWVRNWLSESLNTEEQNRGLPWASKNSSSVLSSESLAMLCMRHSDILCCEGLPEWHAHKYMKSGHVCAL